MKTAKDTLGWNFHVMSYIDSYTTRRLVNIYQCFIFSSIIVHFFVHLHIFLSRLFDALYLCDKIMSMQHININKAHVFHDFWSNCKYGTLEAWTRPLFYLVQHHFFVNEVLMFSNMSLNVNDVCSKNINSEVFFLQFDADYDQRNENFKGIQWIYWLWSFNAGFDHNCFRHSIH